MVFPFCCSDNEQHNGHWNCCLVDGLNFGFCVCFYAGVDKCCLAEGHACVLHRIMFYKLDYVVERIFFFFFLLVKFWGCAYNWRHLPLINSNIVFETHFMIIIIIIAFKGAIRDFLQSPHSAANCLQHVRSVGPGTTMCKSRATHRALITCKCHVTCHLVRRDSSAIKCDRVETAFIWALFYWLNH